MEIYRLLYRHFGPQNWWPVSDPKSPFARFEIATGAILTQNTNWKNVESALKNLKEAGRLSPEGIGSISEEEFSEIIRPSGYFRVKAKRLKNYVDFLMENYDGDVDSSLSGELSDVRKNLLSVSGIGPETADSILLYAGERPVFVIDVYTKRVLARHDLASMDSTYDELQSLFMKNLPEDTALFNEYHALFVAVGKRFCRPKEPLCSECPLSSF